MDSSNSGLVEHPDEVDAERDPAKPRDAVSARSGIFQVLPVAAGPTQPFAPELRAKGDEAPASMEMRSATFSPALYRQMADVRALQAEVSK